MANSTTGDGSYSPNITAGDGYDSVGGNTGSVYLDTGDFSVDFIASGRYGSGQPGDVDGTITVTGNGTDVDVSDAGLYAYSRITVGRGIDTNVATGVLDILNGATITSTNNASVASGSIPLGGYSNLRIGVDGPNATGAVSVSGENGGQRSSLILNGGSAGFVMGSDGGTGTLTIDDGAYFRTLTGVIGQGNTGSPDPGGTGTVTVEDVGSEFKASTLSGNFLIDSDQAPVIIVGQNDGRGYLNADNEGLILIQNEVGDGKSSPTLIFGDDPGSYGRSNINNGAELRITQYGPAATGNRLNGNSGLIVGNGGEGYVGVVSTGSEINVLGDRASIIVSRGSYDAQGAPLATGGQSRLSVYFSGEADVNSLNYGGQGGATATVGAGRLSDGYLQVGSSGVFTVRSATDIVGDETSGKITIGDLGNGQLRVGSFGSVYGRELVIGARGYTANALDNSTDQIFSGYNAAPDGGGTGVATVNSGSSKVVITGTDNSPDRGITIGQASGSTGTLNIDYAGSYVKSTGGFGSIVIGEYGTGTVNVTNNGSLYGGFITVGLGTTAAVDTLTISGAGSKTVASGVYTNVLFGGVSNGQSAVVEIARQDGAYGRLVINSGGELQILNDAGNDQNPTLLVATEDSYGRVEVDGAGSAINITQNGARFLAPSGDTFGGAEAIIGKVGYARVDLTDQAEINIVGDSAMLSVGDGGYDAVGDPIISTDQSNLTISGGSAVLVDSQTYGFDDTASGYSTGASVYIGRGIGGYGRITVAGTPGGYDSSLTVTSSSDFVNDYRTGGIVVGDLGMGELRVQGAASGFGADTTDVIARSLTVGQSSFYDDGSGRQYGGYLPNVTAAGTGAVTLTGAASVVLTATENTPDRGLTIGRDSGTVGTVSIGTYGSITSQGGEGKIVVGEFGDGTLTLNDGAGVAGFSMDVGIGEGSNGEVVVSGYDMLAGAFSTITLSNQFGDFSGEPEDVGQAGNLRIGVEDGSDGSLTINGGGIVNVINQNGTTYDAPTVQIGRDNGAVGNLNVDGYYGGGSIVYYSTLNITQTGNVGDFVATGGVGPIGPRLFIGQGGQGIANVSNQGQILIQGSAARLLVASGGRDAAGNPDTTADRSELLINSGGVVTVDSLSYGGTQDFVDGGGATITASLGAQVVVGGDEGTNGLIAVSGGGSALRVISADETAGDYETGRVSVGVNAGQGELTVSTGAALEARGLDIGKGVDSVGDVTVFDGDVSITGTDATRYQGIVVGRAGGDGSLSVRQGSEVTSSGGAGRLQVGREGTGTLTLRTDGDVNAFFADVGRGAGSDGNVFIRGYGSTLTVSDEFGAFDPNISGPRGGVLTVGREDGGDGYIDVYDGGSLVVTNDEMAAPAVQGDGATLEIGRDTGATGLIAVSDEDGMGNFSTLRVQAFGRSNDAFNPGEYYGPEIRLGRDGGQGTLNLYDGGIAEVIGERAQVIIGQGTENGAGKDDASLVSVSSAATLLVDGSAIDGAPAPYNAGADIIIGEETDGNGRLLVTGAGSTVTVLSDNATDYYDNTGEVSRGAGITVGQLGDGILDVEAGGQIVIEGTDDVFPNLTIGYGEAGATISARGYATVTGAGSLIEINGTRTDVGGTTTFGAGGLIEVGVNDGTIGSLTIADGGSVQNSVGFSKTQIAREVGSTGDVTVTGAGSTFNAGDILTVGAFETGNMIVTDQSGAGTLTIADQAVVTVTSTVIGDSGTLSITNATLGGTVAVSGDFQVGGLNTEGNATILGSLTQTSGVIEFDVNGSSYDQLEAASATFSGSAITIDVVDASTFTVGDSFTLFMTTGSLAIDSTETINFVGENALAGQQFTVVQDADPFGGMTVEMLNFVVEQATLATIAGDLEIIVEDAGQVALTSADISIFEAGVDPALQTLTANNVFGGQLESALDPGVAVTSFSQQDVDDRLIRFVSDGSSGGAFDLSFTDSSGFTETVFIEVASPGVADVNVAEFTNGQAVAFDGVFPGGYLGYSVSSAGDINGDGIDDLIIGATGEEGGEVAGTGGAFVVFGSLNPFPNDFDLNSLDGTNGFELFGSQAEDLAGRSVSAVGDVNGDGIDDLAIGAPGAASQGGANDAGALYILFGDTGPVDPSIALAGLTPAEGIIIDGGAANDGLGFKVVGGQDFNGDGVADIAVSAYQASLAGDVFVVFGDDAGLTGPADTTGLNGANGFRLTGLGPSELLGSSISMADLDGDGLSDLVIGAEGAQGGNGSVFVVKGTTTTAATVDVTTLNGADGFRIDGLGGGDALGLAVSTAGDFNGDGIEDIVIGSPFADIGGQLDTGSVYVIFGEANGFAEATFDLNTLDGANGFQIDGRAFSDNFGYSVSSVGDMNGDGFDDLLVGAPNADPQGMITGEAYLIFGSDEGFAAQQDVSALTTDQLALITSFNILDAGGFATGGGFDLNGDGLDDAVVGAPNADAMDEGGAIVVFGALTPTDPIIEGDLLIEAAQGQSGVITSVDLIASEPDALPAELLYHVTNPVGGFVAAVGAPGTPISTFTQADIDAGLVVFTKDTTTELGSFDVTVTDIDGDVGELVTVAVQTNVGANSFNLSDLDGTNGFQLNGIAPTDQSGLSVSSAGDINGDGFDDVIVGAQQANGGGINDSGETYVVFGAAGGFATQIELSSLDGTNGFRLTGTGAVDLSGGTVSAAGDLNNDGIDDLLVGIRNADRPSFNEGEVVVIYGSTTPFPATRALTGFDGTDGTSIIGADTNSLTGVSLSEAGDVNGDGIDDFIIGSPFADSSAGNDAGESFVVFGVDGGLGASFNLTTLDGSNGFRIDGPTPGFLVGLVGGIGDINDDGFNDIAVSSQVADPASGADAGITYVVFGGPTADAVVNVGALDGTNGFRLDGLVAGDQSGRSLSAAGDINNDGVDDFLIGAFATDPNGVSNAGSVYVVFGETGGPAAGAATFDLASLDGTNGFEIQGVDANDRVGYSVSNIGDFDGDGISDILISADAGDPFDIAGAGEAYIVFGQEGGFDATLRLSDLDGTNGLRLNGIDAGDSTARSISGAGDVNNDGRDDIIIGAFNADPGGLTSAGQSYVVFGFGPNQPPIARDDAIDVFADIPVSGDLFADNGDDIDEDVDGDPFTVISVNGDATQVGTQFTLPSGASLIVQSDGLFDYAANGVFDTLAEGELAADIFTYTIGNAAGEQSTATVDLTVEGVNDAPIAFDDNLTVTEDNDLAGSVFDDNGFGADLDIDNSDVISVVSIDGSRANIGQPVTLSGGGQIILNDDGSFQFSTLNAYDALADGETTTETFTYNIIDEFSAQATATVNLEITGVNDAPVAQDDTFLTDEDTAVSGDLFSDNGLGADADIDSSAFTVTAVNGVAANVGSSFILPGLGGDLFVQADGTFDYLPGADADALADGDLGAVSFTYEITDDFGAVSTANALITLTGLNDAPEAINDRFSITEDDDLTGNLFDDNGNGADFDIDLGDSFTVTAINGVAANVGQQITLSEGGLITINDDGSFSFAANNAYEEIAQDDDTTEDITYTITDSQGATSTATLNLNIQGVNDAPVAQDDDVSIIEGDVATFDVISDNGNGIDFDIDNDQLTVISANGQAVPSGGATNFFTATGLAITIDSTGALTLNAASPALDVLGDGEQLVDSFTYVLEDEFGATDTAQVNVTVNGVNDAPVANDDQFVVIADETLIFDPIAGDGAGGQDIDPEGAQLSIVTIDGQAVSAGDVIALQSGANVAVSMTGELEYRPSGAFDDLAPNQSAQDAFSYEIEDEGGLRSAAQIQIQVDAAAAPPIAADDTVVVGEDGLTTINVFADNGAGPDQDFSGIELLLTGINDVSIANGASVTLASGAVLTIDDAGLVAYNPGDVFAALAEGQTGSDSFFYTITDGVGFQDIGEVTVSVTGANDAPVAANDLLRTDERSALTANLFADNGAGPDADVDGDFTLVAVNGDTSLVGNQITLPSGAVVTINSDGSLDYDPNGAFLTLNDGEEALEQLTYTIADDLGATSEATVVFAVDGITDTIFGTDGNDVIRGTALADDIDGGGGDDLITGLAGNDTIKGGQGLDIIRGGADDDVITGGADKDVLFGEAGNDQMQGGGGNDRLLGLAGNDTISGDAGNDLVSGGRGRDVVSGQTGDDTLRGGRNSDTLFGGDGSDRLQGGGGADSLLGGTGDDRLIGGVGADTLSGDDGIDRLLGKRGNDELTGGQGADRFIFDLGDGRDTITDFEQGVDRIWVVNGVDNFADLTISQIGDDALITFGNVRILALDEDANDFTNSDFIL